MRLEDTPMQDFLGVPLLILAAILGALSIFLLATGLCKAALLLRTPALPDIIPRQGNQTCRCGLRALARNPAAIVQCVVKFDEPHTALAEKVPALLNPKLEEQRSPSTPDTDPLASNSQPPSNLTDDTKIEILNKEISYPCSFH